VSILTVLEKENKRLGISGTSSPHMTTLTDKDWNKRTLGRIMLPKYDNLDQTKTGLSQIIDTMPFFPIRLKLKK